MHGGGGGSEGVGDVPAEASIPIGTGDAAGGIGKDESFVCELFAQLGNLTGATDDLRPRGAVADDFGSERVVPFLA